jgi:hypothetical protein
MNVSTTPSKVNQVFAFGDSWAYGSELQDGEQPFVHWFAESVDMPYTNFGQEGSSLAIVLKTIVDNLLTITKDSIVLVIIPPDVRWYSETEKLGFYTITDWDEYLRIAGDHSMEWFIYHHAVFIYTIQKLLNDCGCQYILAHNYGSIDRLQNYSFPIDYNNFLSRRDLTSILSNKNNAWTRLFHDPEAELFTGKYFEGCIHHPNLLGHKRIAELMLEKYRAR